MKRLARFAALAGLMIAIGSPAQAGDRAFNWTGLYIGVDAGYLSGDADYALAPGTGYASNPKPSGFVGGGHIGYRWQSPSKLVLGVELDAWGADASDADNLTGVTNLAPVKVNWGGSVRGVAGMAFERSLLYATGGWAWIDFEGCTTSSGGGPCAPNTNFSDTRTGWTVGGGYAYAFTPSLSARVEYLYADYGKGTYTTTGVTGNTTSIDLQTHTVRGGLSWKFN
jgi:outer membrane immunogenic protein